MTKFTLSARTDDSITQIRRVMDDAEKTLRALDC